MRDIAAAVLAAAAGVAYCIERHALIVTNAIERGTLSAAPAEPQLWRIRENPAVWVLSAGAVALFIWARASGRRSSTEA